MKYAKFSDDFLSDFRLDDNGETLVLTDKRGLTRAVKLLPYVERPQGEWARGFIHALDKAFSEFDANCTYSGDRVLQKLEKLKEEAYDFYDKGGTE